MQNGSKLGHSKCQENGPEKSTWKMGNKVGILRYGLLQNPSQKGVDQRHHLHFMALSPIFRSVDKANIIAGCL
jgi:hypothetical protein